MKEEEDNFLKELMGTNVVTISCPTVQKTMEKVKRSIERLMDNRFIFDSPWDMEPCSKNPSNPADGVESSI